MNTYPDHRAGIASYPQLKLYSSLERLHLPIRYCFNL